MRKEIPLLTLFRPLTLRALGVEVFREPATANQRGLWVDRIGGRCVSVGIGASVLTVARLPSISEPKSVA